MELREQIVELTRANALMKEALNLMKTMIIEDSIQMLNVQEANMVLKVAGMEPIEKKNDPVT